VNAATRRPRPQALPSCHGHKGLAGARATETVRNRSTSSPSPHERTGKSHLHEAIVSHNMELRRKCFFYGVLWLFRF
jgi:hypothetical protein